MIFSKDFCPLCGDALTGYKYGIVSCNKTEQRKSFFGEKYYPISHYIYREDHNNKSCIMMFDDLRIDHFSSYNATDVYDISEGTRPKFLFRTTLLDIDYSKINTIDKIKKMIPFL
jgi:hypothetical protein